MSDGLHVMQDFEGDGAATNAAVDAAITRALEARPQVSVPEGFAAKVRAALPERNSRRVRKSVGVWAAWGGAAALMMAVCWVAPHAKPSVENLAFDMEMLLMLELTAVAVWLGVRNDLA